jgi:hypothetical protein
MGARRLSPSSKPTCFSERSGRYPVLEATNSGTVSDQDIICYSKTRFRNGDLDEFNTQSYCAEQEDWMKKLCSLFVASLAIGIVLLPNDTQAQSSGATPASVQNASKRCRPVRPGTHESYHWPPITKLPDGISFATNWTQVPTGGWSGQQVMDSCRMQADGFLTWHGKAAVRVEVQPNDDPLALHANSERAEMLLMQDAKRQEIRENIGSGTQYYATSYYFPASWQGQQLPWSAFAPIDCSAGNQNKCNSWSFVWQFYGWEGMSAARMWTVRNVIFLMDFSFRTAA